MTTPDSSFFLTVDADWVPGSPPGYECLLDLAARRGLTLTTFFTTGFCQEAPELVRRTAREGHEIGSHGCSHAVDRYEQFDRLPYGDQVILIDRSRRRLEQVSGISVRSFRAPDLRYNTDTIRALDELGFHVESSAPALRFDWFLSASRRPLRRILTRPTPHVLVAAEDRDVDWPLVEVPPSSFGVPVVMSLLRRYGNAPLHAAARLAGRLSGFINFYCHPWEFVPPSERYVPQPSNSNWSSRCEPENMAQLERFCTFVTEDLGYRSRSMKEHVESCDL